MASLLMCSNTVLTRVSPCLALIIFTWKALSPFFVDAPNGLTEMNYTREHKENVTNILQSVNQHVCDGIAQMRGLRNFDDPSMWNLVHNHGTFTAEDAHKIGLIDYMPSLDPLDQLVDSTQSENVKEEMKKKWGKTTDMHNFHAKEKIELRDYLSLLEKRKQRQERSWKIRRTLKQLAEKSTATRAVLKVMGFEDPYYNIDKVRTLRNLIFLFGA